MINNNSSLNGILKISNLFALRNTPKLKKSKHLDLEVEAYVRLRVVVATLSSADQNRVNTIKCNANYYENDCDRMVIIFLQTATKNLRGVFIVIVL